MSKYEEDTGVGKEAYDTFKKFFNLLPETHPYKQNMTTELCIGMIWFTAFCEGYDFAKKRASNTWYNKESLN